MTNSNNLDDLSQDGELPDRGMLNIMDLDITWLSGINSVLNR